MAVNYFGSGVVGLSILASMHTPPTAVDFRMERKNDYHPHTDFSSSLHELLNTHTLKFRAIVAHLHAGNLLLFLTHIKFRVLSAVVVHPRAQEELLVPHGV